MANYIALHVFYGTSYLVSNYKYISYAILISQDPVLSPTCALPEQFLEVAPLGCCVGQKGAQPDVLKIGSCVMYQPIWPGW